MQITPELNFYIIILMNLLLVGIFLIQLSNHRINKIMNRDVHLNLLKEYEEVIALLKLMVSIPDIQRASVLQSNAAGADPKMGDAYLMSVIMSEGEQNDKVKKIYQGAVISDDYSDMLIKLGENKQYYFVVDELKDSWLKHACQQTGTKEVLMYHLRTSKTKLIYGSVATKEVGLLRENETKVQSIIKELVKIYK